MVFEMTFMYSVSELVKQSKTSGEAAMVLSHNRLYGIGCKPDRRAAFNAVRLAARHGHADGRRAYVYMTAAGIGTKPNHGAAMAMLRDLAKEDRFAAVQLSLLEQIEREASPVETAPKILSSDPYIALYRGFFSPTECKYLAMVAAPWLEAGRVAENGGFQVELIRDADASAISHLTEDMITQRINARIAAATETKIAWGEPLNVLRYKPGQQFRPHHDGRGSDGATRIMTALAWLNEQFEGGETDFPALGIRVRGGVGDMLVFRNVLPDGRQDDRVVHAGLPVTEGVKWMASRWIRGEDFLD